MGLIPKDTWGSVLSLKPPPPQVEPAKYYEACVSDACACDSGGDCECFCTAVAAYAQACHEVGVCVSWRSPDVCRECTGMCPSGGGGGAAYVGGKAVSTHRRERREGLGRK